MSLRDTIAAQVRRRRKQLGLSQKALAERMGTSSGAISNIETSKRGVPDTMLERLAAALGCSVSSLTRERT